MNQFLEKFWPFEKKEHFSSSKIERLRAFSDMIISFKFWWAIDFKFGIKSKLIYNEKAFSTEKNKHSTFHIQELNGN